MKVSGTNLGQPIKRGVDGALYGPKGGMIRINWDCYFRWSEHNSKRVGKLGIRLWLSWDGEETHKRVAGQHNENAEGGSRSIRVWWCSWCLGRGLRVLMWNHWIGRCSGEDGGNCWREGGNGERLIEVETFVCKWKIKGKGEEFGAKRGLALWRKTEKVGICTRRWGGSRDDMVEEKNGDLGGYPAEKMGIWCSKDEIVMSKKGQSIPKNWEIPARVERE